MAVKLDEARVRHLNTNGITTIAGGHIYLTGSQASSSTGNTTQIVFGTSSSNHVALSSNNNAFIINPTTSSTTNQIVLYLDQKSKFPSGIDAGTGGITTAGAISATGNISGNYIQGTWLYTSAATAQTTTSKIAVIHSDNYIYYITPANLTTLIKDNASGTWAINISGSSASCTGNAATATVLGKSGLTADTIDNVTHNGLLYGTISSYTGPGFGSNDAMILSMAWNNGNSYGAQIALDDTTTPNMYVRNKASSWSAWSKVLLSTNYSSYALPLAGGTLNSGAQILRASSSQSWVNGRKGALLAHAYASANRFTSNQYNPLWSAKSINGSWDCGTYTANNNLYFTYITDTNFDAGTNTTTHQVIISGNDGKITASGFVGNATTATTLANSRSLKISSTPGTTGTSFNGSADATLIIPATVKTFTELGTNKISSTAALYITPASTLYLDSAASTSILFRPQGTEKARFNTSGEFLIHTAMYPGTNNTYNLGTSSYKWANVYATTFNGALSGNATTASALTSITTTDAASSSATWRRIWMCWSDNATGRPAYDDRFAIQTSTGTLKAPVFSGNLTGNVTGNISGSSGSCTGNAATASAWATARTLTLAGDLSGSVSVKGNADMTLTAVHYCSAVGSDNTSSYPYHRIAYIVNKSGTYNDTDCILDIKRNYDNAAFGRIKISFRTNSSGAAVSCNARWIYRSGFAVDDITIAWWGVTGNACYADVFLKVGSWARTTVYQPYGSRSWTLVSSNEGTNGANPTEAYTTVAAAGTALHGQAYTSTAAAIDTGIVNSANSATTASSATVAATLGKSGGTSGPMKFYWSGQSGQPSWLWGGSDGTNMYVYNPSNFSVNYATSAGSAAKVNNVIPEWSGSIAWADTSWIAAWNNDGTKIKALAKSSFAAAGHTHSYAGSGSAGGAAHSANKLNINNSAGLTDCLQYIQTSSQTAGNDLPSASWHHVLKMNHGNGDTYYKRLIAFDFWGQNEVYTTTAEGNGTVKAWKKFWIEGDSVTGAVWNDYAEYRESDCKEFGRVLAEKGDDTLTKTTKRLQPFAGVSSDTWGFCQGETEKAKTPIAVAGRVLVYTYRNRKEYKPGDVVCAAPNGTVDIMTREEIIKYPDRIVGTVSCVPEYETWGSGDRDPVKVGNRIWIKVR